MEEQLSKIEAMLKVLLSNQSKLLAELPPNRITKKKLTEEDYNTRNDIAIKAILGSTK